MQANHYLAASAGAGGYIYADGDKYRVFAACYQNGESIKEVRARLSRRRDGKRELRHGTGGIEWVVTATEPQIAALAALLDQLSEIGERLYAAVYAFDRKVKRSRRAKRRSERSRTNSVRPETAPVFSVTETGASGAACVRRNNPYGTQKALSLRKGPNRILRCAETCTSPQSMR